MFYTKYLCPLGTIILVANSQGLCNLWFKNEFSKQSIHPTWQENKDFFTEIIAQLNLFFAKKLSCFNVKLNICGTDFQKKVWQQLQKIPYGKTVSYKQIAIAIGNPKAARAVGQACNKNTIAIIVPCHRVIAQNNKLTGYAFGLNIKKSLLNLEKNKLK